MTMRSIYGGLQDAPASPAPAARPTAVPSSATKEIPYDHVAVFPLLGQRGNRVQDVINVSIDGAFVAVAIGYSFVPDKPVELPTPVTTRADGSDAVAALADWLLGIVRLDPTLANTL